MASLDFERWGLPVQPVDLIITDGLFGKEEHRPRRARFHGCSSFTVILDITVYPTGKTTGTPSGRMMFLFLLLAVSGSLRVHVAGALLAWSGYIIALVLQTLEITGTR